MKNMLVFLYFYGGMVTLLNLGTTVSYSGNCLNGWFEYGSYCYFLQSGNATFQGKIWQDSLSQCQRYNGSLLDIENEEENLFILNLLQDDNRKNKSFWIGLRALPRSYMWSEWLNGTSSGDIFGFICKVDISIWSKYQNVYDDHWLPFGNYSYTLFIGKSDVIFQLSLLKCSQYKGSLLILEDEVVSFYIAEFHNSGFNKNNNLLLGLNDHRRSFMHPAWTSTNGYFWGFICKVNKVSCSNGWLNYGKYCYFMYSANYTNQLTVWTNSLLKCQSNNGSLLVIDDEAVAYVVANYRKNITMKNKRFLIGVNALQRSYVWSVKSVFSNWIGDKPDDFYRVDDCVSMNNNGWQGNNCNNLFGYICKVKIDTCSSICHRDAACVGATCICKRGYIGDGVSNCSFLNGCTNDSSTDFQLTSTGYLAKDIYSCVSFCNSFTPPGVFQYAFFLEGQFCFCRNASLPELETSKFSSPCVTSSCFNNINDSDCFLSTYEVFLLSFGVVQWSITYKPDTTLVNNEVQIQANILIGDTLGAFMIPKSIISPAFVQTVNSTTVKSHFYVPGLQEWSAEIGNNFTEPYAIVSWIQIDEYVNGIHLIPTVGQTDGAGFLVITEGTNVSLVLSIPTIQSLTFSADIIRLMHGLSSSILYSNSGQRCDLTNGFTLKVILESGRFTKVKLKRATHGYFRIAILRPLCSGAKDICVSAVNCTSACFGKMLLNASSSSTITALVVYSFYFLTNGTGVIEIPIQNNHNEILENDMVWIGGTGSLYCNGVISKPPQYFGRMIGKTVTFLANAITNIDFFVSLFITKPFEYLIPKPSSYGIFNIAVIAFNNIPSYLQLNFLLYNQIPVSNLSFDYMKPCPYFIAGYKLNSWITLKAVIDNGTDVLYMFNIPKLNYTSIVSSSEIQFKAEYLGVFTVYLTAANKLNSLNTSIYIGVLSEINDISLFVEANLVQNVAFFINGTIFNGTNVKLIVDFGDGLSVFKKENINATSVNGFVYSLTYMYSSCNTYQITAFASTTFANWTGTFNESITKTKKVTVFCPLSPMNVTTLPINSPNRYVPLSPNQNLTLNIHQYTGSYMVYSVDWGDGIFYVNDQTMNVVPVSFQVQHMYKTENTYTILVICKNYIQSVNQSIVVLVKNCSAPEVHFYYGTFLNPMIVMQSVGVDLTVDIGNNDPLCKDKNYNFEWNITSYSGKSIITQNVVTVITQLQQKITYRIRQKSLDSGFYMFSVLFKYGIDSTFYVAYLNVILSPLYIIIDNGFFNSIAYKIKNGNESSHQNFTISAMSSYDPDDPSIGTQNITFKWSCKIAGNVSFTLDVMENFKRLNLSYKSDSCFSPTWISIPFFNPCINYSTHQFLEGVSYHIEVCGTKYAGKDVDSNEIIKTNCFIQELFILAEGLPTVTVRCISNCEKKINYQDRVIYLLTCENCGSARLSALWTITDDANTIPPEIVGSTNASTTGFFNPSLAINPNILLESKSYTFSLIVGFADSYKRVKFEFTRSTCSKPIPGYCFISPTEGYALETKFIIACFDWSDLDGLLSYRFYYDNGQSQFMYMSSTKTVDYPILNAASTYQPSLVGFIIGPGDENNNYITRIIIKVSGKYNAYTEYSLFIKVCLNNKPWDIEELLSGISLNDTQSIALLVQAVSSVANKNLANYSSDLPLPINLFTGLVESSDLIQERQQNLSRMQENRRRLIGLLINVPINGLIDFKIVADALALATKYPLELNFQAQIEASNILIKLAGSLIKKNLEGLGPDSFDSMTQSFVKSISNLFQASVITGSLNHTIDKEALNLVNKQVVSNLLKSLEIYFFAIQFYKVSAEYPTVGQTSQFTFELRQNLSSDLSNIPIGSFDNNEYGFILPHSKDIFNMSVQNLLVNNLRIKIMVYTWDTNQSSKIISETQSLSFFGLDNQPVVVSNTSQPIYIAIKNIAEKINGKNISLSMPNDIYQYKLSLTSDCNMLLKFMFRNDPNNLTNLIVYIQYGKVATKLDHDIMLNISAKHGVVMTKNDFISFNTKGATTSNETRNSFFGGLQRYQDVLLLEDGTITLWNFTNWTYAFLNINELHLSFSYIGPIPAKRLDVNPYTFDKLEYSGTFDYEMKSFCAECSYWNEDTDKWMSDGCKLDIPNTSFFVTKCKCSHLTAFGGLFVAPNPLPLPSIALLKSGYALTVTVAVVILLWLVGLVFCRRMDKKDVSKIGVCPLIDNRPEDTYLYQIIVSTGSRRSAGTKSKIFLNVFGNLNESGVRHLIDPERACFQRSSYDVFIMATHSTLGDLDFIRVWHDNSGGSWYVKNIVINDLQTEKKFIFIGHRWIAVECGMCTLDYVIPVASVEEEKHFKYVFTSKAKNDLSDNHLWFSVFARPPKSTFTRCQRLSVAVSLIMTSMMVSAMYYLLKVKESPAEENRAIFAVTTAQVFVALVCTAIKFPIHFILMKLFHLIKPLNQSLNKVSPESSNTQSKTHTVIVEEKPNSIRKRRVLQSWCLYLAWFICVSNILVCGFVVLWYGMFFGNKKSLNWLASIVIDFTKDIFLTGPIKIFILAIFFALFVKKIKEEESEVEKKDMLLLKDESWLYRLKDVATIFENVSLQPLDSVKVNDMREKKIKQIKMGALTNEIIVFTIYAVLVMFIGYSTRSNVAFKQTQNVQDLFNLTLRGVPWPRDYSKIYGQIVSAQDFWFWIKEFFLLQVYPFQWDSFSDFSANTKKQDLPGKLFLNDLNSKIVNGIRIRQIRVQPNSCLKAYAVAKFIKIDCLSSYKIALEETRDFDFNWTIPKKYKTYIYPSTMPWRYQTWQELDGYPYTANIDTYSGGGYVIEIFPKWDNTAILNQAKDFRWIDRQTRAVIIEFALFNAATNYLSMVTMVLEFPASGGVVPNFSALTFKLYAFLTESKTLLGSYVLFILMTILFAIRELRFFYRSGTKYLLEFWNLVEVVLIILSTTAVGFFFYKDHLAKVLLQRMPTKKPQAFINFQFVSYWDLTYVYIVSLIVFFVTLKFIKLLRFNRRVSMLSSTLKAAWHPLSMFGITFFIIMCSIVSTSSIMFGSLLDGYQNYFKTVASIISLLLGKFSYSQFENANNILGPIFFFGFNIIIIWIVMNIFMSILMNAFCTVRANLQFQTNDYEMVDFILNHLKDWLRFSFSKERTDIGLNKVATRSNHLLLSSPGKTKLTQLDAESNKGLNDVQPQLKVEKLIPKNQIGESWKSNVNDIKLSSLKKSKMNETFAVESAIDDQISHLEKYNFLLIEDNINDINSLDKFIRCASVVYEENLKRNEILN